MNQSGELLSFNLPLLVSWKMEINGDNVVTPLLWACPVVVLWFPREREEQRIFLLCKCIVPGHIYGLLGVWWKGMLSSHQHYL